MTLAAYVVSAPPRADGKCGTFYPVNLISPDVTWNNAGLPDDLVNRPNGTTISEDMRVLLSGVGAATAVLTVVIVSGPANDWGIGGGDNLTNDGTTNGEGVIKVRATYLGSDFDSANMSWSIVTPAPPDTLSPTEVLFKSLVAIDTTKIALEVFPPVDPKNPTSDAKGLLSVSIEREISGEGYAEVASKAVSAGLSLQYSGTNIGSVTPAPSFTQNISFWDITAAGAEIWQTTDELAFVHTSLVGDFVATVLCKQITGVAGVFSKAGIMARDGTAADAPWACVFSMCDPSDGANDYVKGEYRPSAGASAQAMNAKTGGLTGDRYLRLERVGNVFSTYYWQTSIADWVLLGSQSITMPTSVEVGLAVSSQDINNEITVNFEQFAVQNLPIITHSDTGLTANINYNYRARAKDLESPANTGAFGPVRPITTPAAPPTGQNYEDVIDDNIVGYAKHWNVTGGAGRPLVVVTNLNNSGPGSLRQALADNPNGSWIIFSQGLTGSITLNSTLGMVANTTIDGRGANITIIGPNSSAPAIAARLGDFNWILMYLIVDSRDPNPTDQDNINIFNSNSDVSNPNRCERFWIYHVSFLGAEDENLNLRRMHGKYTIQSCLLRNNSGGASSAFGTLIANSASGAWQQQIQLGTFYRNEFDSNHRQPYVAAPSNIHLYNNYHHDWASESCLVAAQVFGDSPLVAQALCENDIWDGNVGNRSFYPGPTGSSNDGETKGSGNLHLNGAFGTERNPGSVFVPPYTYPEMQTATTGLRDAIVADVGWQNVTNPAH